MTTYGSVLKTLINWKPENHCSKSMDLKSVSELVMGIDSSQTQPGIFKEILSMNTNTEQFQESVSVSGLNNCC